MRKILSMMLAVALVLTTLALPMSAFAADPVMTVTYAIDTVNGDTPGAEIYPGDEVVVSVSLTAVTDTITLTDLEFINTVANDLDGTWAAADGITNNSSTEGVDEDFLVTDSSISVTTAGTKIMTGTFTMPNDTASYAVNATGFTAYGGGVEYDTTVEKNVTITPLTISVVQPENVIKVGDSVLSSADAVPTVYAQSATITWTSDSSKATAAYSLDNAEPVAITDGSVEVSTAGTYVITITYGNALTYTRSFTLSTESVDGVISTTIGLLGDATDPVVKYKRGETFTVPVVLTTGPSTDIVGSVAFTVAYDTDVLSMTAAESNVAIEDNKVTYTASKTSGEDNDLLKQGETVATLTFTVLNTAAYANTTITFAGVGLAIEGDLSNTNQKLEVSQPSTSILVMPADPLAAVDKAADLSAQWTNVAYTVDVTTTVGTTKLYVAEGITDDGNQDTYKNWYEADTATVVENSITIDDYKDYAIVTKLGDTPAEYQVVLITAEETKFDNTPPTVNRGEGMSDWLRTDDAAKSLTVTDFGTAEDAISGVEGAKIEYYFGTAEGEPAWSTVEGTTIPVDQNSEETKLTIKWYDAAGNPANPETYDLKLDATEPVINVTAPGAAVEGTKTVTFTVSDDHGEVATESIKVYTSTAGEITDPSTLTPIEDVANTGGTYSFDVATTTWYYIVANDKAGIAATPVTGQITFAAATTVTELDVQVVKNGNTLKFYDTTAMAAKNILTSDKATAHTGNGTFTYVNITLPEAEAEVTREVTLTKDGAEDTRETYTFDATVDGDIGAYVLTITNKDTSGTEATSTFQFSIVTAENIMTVNGNSVYDVADYGRVRDLVGASKEAPESGALFYGGYYSGDLTGDGVYKVDDYSQLLTNLRARIKEPANSNYPILNKSAAE